MQKVDSEIDFKNGSIKMFGQKRDLIITTDRHYAITIGNKLVIEQLHQIISIYLLMSNH